MPIRPIILPAALLVAGCSERPETVLLADDAALLADDAAPGKVIIDDLAEACVEAMAAAL